MAIVNATIGSSETDILTVTSGKYANLFLSFCNFDTVNSETITVHLRPGGEAVSDENTILKNIVIDPTDTFFVSSADKFLLGVNDKVSAVGVAGGRVSVTASYEPY